MRNSKSILPGWNAFDTKVAGRISVRNLDRFPLGENLGIPQCAAVQAIDDQPPDRTRAGYRINRLSVSARRRLLTEANAGVHDQSEPGHESDQESGPRQLLSRSRIARACVCSHEKLFSVSGRLHAVPRPHIDPVL